jgi:DNA-binding IclR family transcriptional regulator
MLAYVLPDRGAVDGYVDQYGPLEASTPMSVTNAAALDRELAIARSRGWAIDNEENEIGVVCVGFALFLGPTAYPTGAVSVAAIKIRTSLDDLIARTDEVRALIERHLGPGALAPRPVVAAAGGQPAMGRGPGRRAGAGRR